MPRHSTPIGLLAVALLGLSGSPSGAERAPATALLEPPLRPALMLRPGTPTVQLDVARAGSRLLSVGEHGVILVSDDQGVRWRQVASPTSATLTAVRFVDATTGWAVGHYGTVLHSNDGGINWTRQLQGDEAAALALQAAQSMPQDTPAAQHALKQAQRLVADGPDKPFLDICFADARHGFLVGAYNLFFTTSDGGVTWQPALHKLANPKGNHLYAVRTDPRDQGRTVYIAGEAGVLYRSDDGGASFERLKSPYAGSWFALEVMPDGSVVAAGLRGNAFVSRDRGNAWTVLSGLPPVSIVSARASADGRLWLANQAGMLFVGRPDDGPLRAWISGPDRQPPLNAVLPLGPDRVVAASLAGVLLLQGATAPHRP